MVHPNNANLAPAYTPSVTREDFIDFVTKKTYVDLMSPDDPRWQPYKASLDSHLDQLTEGWGNLDQAARKHRLDVREIANTAETLHFVAHGNQIDRPLDLLALGFPEVPNKDGQPLAVRILQEAGKIQEVCLVTAEKSPYGNGLSVKHYYLEAGNVFSDQPPHASPTWVAPGNHHLSYNLTKYGTGDIRSETELGKEADAVGHLAVTVLPFNFRTEIKEPKTLLIRSRPTKAELGTANRPVERKHRRLARRVGAAAAAVYVGMLPIDVRDKPVTSTKAYFDYNPDFDPGHFDDYSHQAEAFIKDPQTFERMKASFDAFFAGDKQGLAAQKDKYLFNNHWVNEETRAKVVAAKTYEELKAAFGQTSHKYDINLLIAENAFKDETSSYQPVDSLESAKEAAIGVLAAMDRLGKATLEGSNGFDIVFATKPDTAVNYDIAGYYETHNNGSRPRIIIDVKNSPGIVFTHEFGHDFAAATGLAYRIDSLNPSGWSYRGDNFEGASTKYKGKRVVARDYGTVDEDEDAATVIENVGSSHPELELNGHNPYAEKQLLALAYFENRSPGFTAAFLERISPARPDEKALDTLGRYKRLIQVSAGLTFLAAMAQIIQLRVVEEQRRKAKILI